MRRWYLPALIGIPLTAVVLLAYTLAAPYIDGRRCSREIAISPNLVQGFGKPLKPVVLLSGQDLKELLDRAKQKCVGIWDPVHDRSGLAEFERSMQGFDFSTECLILIPVMHDYDH